jgi:hypothetical protein
MSWTITEDHVLDGERVGVEGHGVTVGRDTPGAERFHTFDDDGERVFSGWLVDDDRCPVFDNPWESALSFAMHDVGATVIRDDRGEAVVG